MNDLKSITKMLKSNRALAECVAEKLNTTVDGLYLKLASPMSFTLGELAVIKRIFHFSARETLYIFAPWVAFRNNY